MAEKQSPSPKRDRQVCRAFAIWWHDAFVPLVKDAFFPLLCMMIVLLGFVMVALVLLRPGP